MRHLELLPEEFYNQSPHCWLPKTNYCLLGNLIKIKQMNPLSGIFIVFCFSFFKNHQALLPHRSPGTGPMKLAGFQQQEAQTIKERAGFKATRVFQKTVLKVGGCKGLANGI